MNNTYFNRNIFPQGSFESNENKVSISPKKYDIKVLPLEDPCIENLLKNNVGKQVCVYMTFPNSDELKDFKLKGILEQSGRDYVIVSEPSSGKWHLLPSIYINLISFDETINYSSDFS